MIIFSVAVGPDKTGRITAQISSLNSEGGHRRLNVAVTRARSELLVFATLRPEQIDLGRTSAKGVVDFKHFLEFAEHGARAIAEAFSPTGRATESPFEDAVMRALEDKGWEIHPQVGVSFFRVDLGVVHPDFPGRYLAGVECDGATYHRSATARDRDRLREMVLNRSRLEDQADLEHRMVDGRGIGDREDSRPADGGSRSRSRVASCPPNSRRKSSTPKLSTPLEESSCTGPITDRRSGVESSGQTGSDDRCRQATIARTRQ